LQLVGRTPGLRAIRKAPQGRKALPEIRERRATKGIKATR
jgi:hypothetical protein